VYLCNSHENAKNEKRKDARAISIMQLKFYPGGFCNAVKCQLCDISSNSFKMLNSIESNETIETSTVDISLSSLMLLILKIQTILKK
jgi:hypothetical protein